MPTPNQAPRFIEDGKIWAAEISTANTNRDGTGTVVTIVTAAAQGSRVDLVRVVAEGTTTAGVVRLFLHDGSTFFLIKELVIDAVTPSTTTEVETAEWVPTDYLVLPTSWTLRASTHNAETFNVFAQGGDY
jgi:hypothetical protein